MDRYEKPVVTDYGSVEALTEAAGLFGVEDGGAKNEVQHHGAVPISTPIGTINI